MAEKKYEFEETMVTLVDEDGKEKPFYVDEMYMVKDQMYAALIPGDVENVTEYYVFRVKDLGNDDFELEELLLLFELDEFEEVLSLLLSLLLLLLLLEVFELFILIEFEELVFFFISSLLRELSPVA